MSTPLKLVSAVMQSQHSLVTRQQLSDAKVTARQIARMKAIGHIESIRRDIFILAGVRRTWPQASLAAVLAAGDDAVASHATAARLWGFRHHDDSGFEVTVPRGRWPKVDGVRVHSSEILGSDDTSRRKLVPCTSYERTLCDMTTRLSWFQLGRVLDDGLRRELTSLDKLHACVERLDSGPHRRLSIAKGLLAKRTAGYNPGDSNDELRLLEILRIAGLPVPVQQHVVRVDGKRYELDFAWPDVKAFVEYYGLHWHIGASAVAYDSERITDLTTLGWRPAIFTDESSDADIVRKVTKLLDIAAPSRAPQRHGA